MASKGKTVWFCTSCGNESPKWMGRCPACGEWNTMVEAPAESKKSAAPSKARSDDRKPRRLKDIDYSAEARISLGMKELDRLLGGGMVPGSLILIGGEPGIGKSTLSLQIPLGCPELKTLYVTGEESERQIKMRADRLGVAAPGLRLLCETDMQAIGEHIMAEKPDLVIIDSVQTMNHADLSSSPGSVTQVRECTSLLMRTAKSLSIPVILVGHVNKDGNIAGPKVLEHIVDAVLYFEG